MRRRPLPFLAVLALAAGCGTYVAPPPASPVAEPNPGLASSALTGLVDALNGGSGADLTPVEQTAVANARSIGISDVSARYIDAAGTAAADGSWTGDVVLSWHVRGEDAAEEQTGVTFTPAGTSVRITGFGTPGRPVPLWLLGPVKVARDAGVTVIAVGRDPQSYLRMATTAITQIRQTFAWPDPHLVIEVPPDQRTLEQVLGGEPDSERGVAAFTGPADGRAGGPVHIFVNPDVIGSGRDAQIVLTHEAVHAATNAAGNTNLPAWMREGYADYVALRAQNLPLSITADRALATVRKSGAPDHLPADADFNSQSEDFGEEYQFAWLVWRYLGEVGGPARATQAYDAVAQGATVDVALGRTYGMSAETLTARWRAYLAALAKG